MLIRDARAQATQQLRAEGIDTAPLDARLLMMHVLGVSHQELVLSDGGSVSPDQLDIYCTLVARRAEGEPLAYLTGQREFMGLTFTTGPDVLIPRPDTEPLVEWALEWLRLHPEATVADIGTGSGAIAISIMSHSSVAFVGSVHAVDVSDDALVIARKNADRLLDDSRRNRMHFVSGYLTEALKAPVDLLLANLPYLTPEQIAENPDLNHEPRIALDGGVDGLDLIRRVIADLPRVLSPGGATGFEIDPSQADAVQDLLREALPQHQVDVVRDLAGDARHIVAYQ